MRFFDNGLALLVVALDRQQKIMACALSMQIWQGFLNLIAAPGISTPYSVAYNCQRPQAFALNCNMIDKKSVASTHVVALCGFKILGKLTHFYVADICFSQCLMQLIKDQFSDGRRGRDRYDLDWTSRALTSGPPFPAH